MSLIHYFAYGSNMSLPRIQARLAQVRTLGQAVLTGHQLRFHKAGDDGSAKCDAYASAQNTELVHGVLFQLSQSDLATLDQIEGVGFGYQRKAVKVNDAAGNGYNAYTYSATQIDPDMQPYHWYKFHVVNGAEQAQLPHDYCQWLASTQSIDDPDTERHQREMAIYHV